MNPMTATEVADVPRDVWTAEDVAAYLRIPRSRVLALARGGAWPSIMVNRRERRFRRRDIEAWVDDEAARERSRLDLQGGRPQEAVGRKRHRGLDPRGKADPKGALRRLEDGGADRAA